ncbi:MAG: hypothetical protein V2A74_03175, partial [bacterium]
IRTHQQVVENYRRDVIVFYESTGEAYEQLSGEYLRLAEQYTELNRPETARQMQTIAARYHNLAERLKAAARDARKEAVSEGISPLAIPPSTP